MRFNSWVEGIPHFLPEVLLLKAPLFPILTE